MKTILRENYAEAPDGSFPVDCVAWKFLMKSCRMNVGQEKKPYQQHGFWEPPMRPAASCSPIPGNSPQLWGPTAWLWDMVTHIGWPGNELENRSRAQVILWIDRSILETKIGITWPGNAACFFPT